MGLPDDLAVLLGQLDDASLQAGLLDLVAAARTAVPSLIDIGVTVTGVTPVTVSLAPEPVAISPVGATLRIELPRSGPAGAFRLLVRAALPGSLNQLAADLVALLDMDPRRAVVDEPVDAVSSSGADAHALLNRALGVLLDRGVPPANGMTELQRVADRDGVELLVAAQALVNATTGD